MKREARVAGYRGWMIPDGAKRRKTKKNRAKKQTSDTPGDAAESKQHYTL